MDYINFNTVCEGHPALFLLLHRGAAAERFDGDSGYSIGEADRVRKIASIPRAGL